MVDCDKKKDSWAAKRVGNKAEERGVDRFEKTCVTDSHQHVGKALSGNHHELVVCFYSLCFSFRYNR